MWAKLKIFFWVYEHTWQNKMNGASKKKCLALWDIIQVGYPITTGIAWKPGSAYILLVPFFSKRWKGLYKEQEMIFWWMVSLSIN